MKASHRRWLLGSIVGLHAFAGAGCVGLIQYTPDASLVQSRGFPEIRRSLSEVTARAVDPRISGVEVTEEFVAYSWSETYPGPFFIPISDNFRNQIYFANVMRVEIYENCNVFLWGPRDQRVDKILFATLEDARLFLDCIMSLRAARIGK